MESTGNVPLEVSVQDVRSRLAAGDDFLLLDCRRPEEHSLVHLDEAVLIPMDELPDRLGELGGQDERPVVVYCHHGGRSMMVTRWLRQQGWNRAQSMRGGIDAWADEIDNSLPRY